jgi:[acyl-carrier-protein] S-malonyltransferase
MNFALTFPGQGSQSVGMLNAYPDFPGIQTTLEEASDILGVDFTKLIAHGPTEELARTVNTQPVMLLAGVACWRAWKSLGGPQPAWLAGHSLGEYTALVASGALEFADALRLVRLRAEAMQAAVPEGAGGIAAILGLDEAPLREACAEAMQTEVVELANLNAPGQIVIAGHRSAVERAIVIAKTKGAKRGVMLPMSVPAHCSLMRPAAQRLRVALAEVDLGVPGIPVLHNASVQSYRDGPSIRDALYRQVFSPVRWVETIGVLAEHGVRAVVELGPGKVLSGLNARIAPQLRAFSTASAADLTSAIEFIMKQEPT